MLIQYQASMDVTQTVIFPPNVTSKGVEGSSKASKGQKKKKHEDKSKEVEDEVVKKNKETC